MNIKEKNLLLLEEILSFRSRLLFGMVLLPRKTIRQSQKYFPSEKNGRKKEIIPIHLNFPKKRKEKKKKKKTENLDALLESIWTDRGPDESGKLQYRKNSKYWDT